MEARRKQKEPSKSVLRSWAQAVDNRYHILSAINKEPGHTLKNPETLFFEAVNAIHLEKGIWFKWNISSNKLPSYISHDLQRIRKKKENKTKKENLKMQKVQRLQKKALRKSVLEIVKSVGGTAEAIRQNLLTAEYLTQLKLF